MGWTTRHRVQKRGARPYYEIKRSYIFHAWGKGDATCVKKSPQGQKGRGCQTIVSFAIFLPYAFAMKSILTKRCVSTPRGRVLRQISQGVKEDGAFQMVRVVKNPPAKAGDMRDTGSIPGSGRSPGGGHGNPLQYSCLENPMDRRAWWLVYGVTNSWTHLKWLSIHACKEDDWARRRQRPGRFLPLERILTSQRLHSSNSHAEFTHGYFHMYSAFLINNILSSIPSVFLSDSSFRGRLGLGLRFQPLAPVI